MIIDKPIMQARKTGLRPIWSESRQKRKEVAASAAYIVDVCYSVSLEIVMMQGPETHQQPNIISHVLLESTRYPDISN